MRCLERMTPAVWGSVIAACIAAFGVGAFSAWVFSPNGPADLPDPVAIAAPAPFPQPDRPSAPIQVQPQTPSVAAYVAPAAEVISPVPATAPSHQDTVATVEVQADPSEYRDESERDSRGDKSVYVHGYYNKNGTYVQPHMRAAPGTGSGRSHK